MAKLIATYTIVLMCTLIGFMSDNYLINKTKTFYFCDCSTCKIKEKQHENLMINPISNKSTAMNLDVDIEPFKSAEILYGKPLNGILGLP